MKALTIHQPWASLLGIKRYETRHWRTFYRGAIAIHAGAKPPSQKDKDLWYRAHELAGLEPPFSADELPLMAIVSVSELRDVKQMSYIDPQRNGGKGWTFKTLRESRGMTQEELSRRSGIKLWWIQEWEETGHIPHFRGAASLASALEVSLQTLMNSRDGYTISIDAQSDLEKMLGRWSAGRYAWDMGGYAKRIDPIAIPGRQGLWNVPSDLIERLEREYGAIAQR